MGAVLSGFGRKGLDCGFGFCYELTFVCIVNPKGTKRKSKKGKEAAGASGNVEAVRVDPTQVLPTQVLPTQTGPVNNETGLPQGPILPTEVNRENVGDQRDQN
ncbi:hypothetical protein Bca4012_072799 [Brassica carinata]|uniref:Uncharacterized protein n=1 Tax=Brassica carinata TaxID=52824 RepID=A0A8X7U9Q1_BRACI|nr:hypothetical protein Bca52824_065154 [Brassica carinata]